LDEGTSRFDNYLRTLTNVANTSAPQPRGCRETISTFRLRYSATCRYAPDWVGPKLYPCKPCCTSSTKHQRPTAYELQRRPTKKPTCNHNATACDCHRTHRQTPQRQQTNKHSQDPLQLPGGPTPQHTKATCPTLTPRLARNGNKNTALGKSNQESRKIEGGIFRKIEGQKAAR